LKIGSRPPFSCSEPPRPPRAGLVEWARIGRRAAEVRSLAGATRFTPQPVVHWPDGGTLSLY